MTIIFSAQILILQFRHFNFGFERRSWRKFRSRKTADSTSRWRQQSRFGDLLHSTGHGFGGGGFCWKTKNRNVKDCIRRRAEGRWNYRLFLQVIVTVIKCLYCNCNCNYRLLNCLWQWDSEGTFRSWSQATCCLPHSVEASHCCLQSWTSIKEAVYTNFIVFGLTQLGIEPESTATVADAPSTRPPFG